MTGHLPGFLQQGLGLFRFGAHVGFRAESLSGSAGFGGSRLAGGSQGCKLAQAQGTAGPRARSVRGARRVGRLGQPPVPPPHAPINDLSGRWEWGWGTGRRTGSPGNPSPGNAGKRRETGEGHAAPPLDAPRPVPLLH